MGCRPFKCMLVRQVLPQEHVGHGAELVVPRFAEAADEGFAQELVEADAALCAEADGILADVPTMVVEAGERAQLLLADGVEVAADGLLSEEAAAGASEGAVAAADDARHQLALGVGIADALAVDDGLCTSRKLVPQGIELCLDVGHFVEGDGGTGIAFLAAASVAAVDVAAEALGEDVTVEDDVAHLDEVTKRLALAHALASIRCT